jgi:pilus assembly protein FimV
VVTVPTLLVACGPRDDARTDTLTTDTYDATGTAADGPITTLTALTGATDPIMMEGREVRILGARVAQVMGDTAFYVTQATATPGAAGAGTGTAGAAGTGATGTGATGTGAPGTAADPAAAGSTTGGASLTAERVRVVRDRMATTPEPLRVGQMVDLYGEVRVRDMGAMGATGGAPAGASPAGTQPTGTPGTTGTTGTGTTAGTPGAADTPGATGTARTVPDDPRLGRGEVYIRATRIEAHAVGATGTGAGATGTGAGTGTQPAP